MQVKKKKIKKNSVKITYGIGNGIQQSIQIID